MNKKVDSSGTNHKYKNKLSTLQQTLHLFKRVPQLKALFFEVLISQFFSSLLNFLFITKVKMSITDDNDRAGWTANVSYLNFHIYIYLFLSHGFISMIIHNYKLFIFSVMLG